MVLYKFEMLKTRQGNKIFFKFDNQLPLYLD
jgi:hypothetical protein